MSAIPTWTSPLDALIQWFFGCRASVAAVQVGSKHDQIRVRDSPDTATDDLDGRNRGLPIRVALPLSVDLHLSCKLLGAFVLDAPDDLRDGEFLSLPRR